MSKKLTNDEYSKRVFEIVGEEYSVLENYIDTKTKILTKHNICGYEWLLSPNKFLMGRRCPKCSIEKTHALQRKSKSKLLEELDSIFSGKIVYISGEYENNISDLSFHCYTCKNDFTCRVGNLLSRKRCPICSNHNRAISSRKKNSEFINEIYDMYGGEYSLINDYLDSKTHVLMRHNNCGTEWNILPSNFLKGHACPNCSLIKRANDQRKPSHVFIKQVEEIGNSEYIVLEEYINNKTKIKFRHIPCGNVVSISPANFLRGRGCYYCSSSNGERKIFNFLKNNNLDFTQEYCFDDCKYKNVLWFDFYIECENLIIEFHGIQHYEPKEFFGGEKAFKEQRKRDKIKEKYCRKNNISLLIIPYWEFDNIEKILEQTLFG